MAEMNSIERNPAIEALSNSRYHLSTNAVAGVAVTREVVEPNQCAIHTDCAGLHYPEGKEDR